MCKKKIKLMTALLAGIMLTGIHWAYAQTSDQVTLNIELVAIQSISVTQETVTLTFDDATDYQDGVSENQPGHLTVSSTCGFQVKVSASGDLSYGSESIPLNTITVEPSGTAGEGETFTTDQTLTTTPTQIISSTSGTTSKNYDVNYESIGGDDYLNIPPGTYTTTVTYTIAPA